VTKAQQLRIGNLGYVYVRRSEKSGSFWFQQFTANFKGQTQHPAPLEAAETLVFFTFNKGISAHENRQIHKKPHL
jgi:hypothetical protein